LCGKTEELQRIDKYYVFFFIPLGVSSGLSYKNSEFVKDNQVAS